MKKMRGNGGVSQGETLEGKSKEELEMLHWKELKDEKYEIGS